MRASPADEPAHTRVVSARLLYPPRLERVARRSFFHAHSAQLVVFQYLQVERGSMNASVYPRGFRSYAKSIGIRDETLDFTVIASDVPAAAAAMFTQSRFCGAAVTVGREHVADGRLQAFVINSKNANVATGPQGLANIREVVSLVAQELEIRPDDVLPSSTGVIGWQLPMERIRAGIRGLRSEMKEGDLEASARAIMTTDTRPKYRTRTIGNAVLVGMAKGVGMIEPNMATMLSYFVTDARIEPAQLRQALQDAVALSFNMVSVDTDTSTSDTVAIMANGLDRK